ncbi:unnamed protein product [Prunus brigantina]
MKKTSIRLELADHSIKYPKGIVEDILVQVNTLILPADFVVMDMEDNPHEGRVDPILLGRPFMATANTIINVKDGTLSMTVLGETIAFKVFDALKPNVVQECFQIEVFGNSGKDKFNGLPHSIEACLLQGVDKEEHVAAHMFNAILPTHKEELPRFGDSLITPPILSLLDLGASINLMPYHVYEKLNLGELQATSVSIQLADRTIRYPKGILEDVLVKVEELILPADFLVLEMEEAPIHDNQLPLILGRPFMATAGAIIDVKKGTLTMNVFDETIAFKVFEASKFPSDEHEVFQLDAIDTMVKEALPMSYLEPIEACITQSIRKEEVDSLEAVISPLLLELVCSMDSYIEVGKRYANQFESLPPPTNKTLPVIIASQLGPSDEKKLLRVLKEHKTAIGWSIADIKGISPTLCMHKILLEDNAMPKRDAQRRLNPNMKEVVRKEVMKLLDVGIIYPISDSKWVSPVQVVPKKSVSQW